MMLLYCHIFFIDIEDREVLLLIHERKCRRLNALAAPILVNALDVYGQSSFSRERVDQLTKVSF